jgi:hypothetical protein
MLTDQTKLSKFESDHAGLEMVSIHQLVLYFLVYVDVSCQRRILQNLI